MKPSKQVRLVMARPSLKPESFARALARVQRKLNEIVGEKGKQAWCSRHEVLGIVTEEYHELVEATRSGTGLELAGELLDVAVACVMGLACLEQETLDW